MGAFLCVVLKIVKEKQQNLECAICTISELEDMVILTMELKIMLQLKNDSGDLL